MKRKEKQWIYPRHTIIRKIAWPIFRHVVHLRYDVELQPFREPERSQYLILLNQNSLELNVKAVLGKVLQLLEIVKDENNKDKKIRVSTPNGILTLLLF